jgi:hypothetical protein
MRRSLFLTLTLAATAGLLLSLPAAYADTVSLTLSNPTESGVSPSFVTFDATVSAPGTNAADVYLNADSYNVDAPLTLDDSDFFNNFPFFLTPGQTFTGDLFVVTIPSATPLYSSYNGYFEILGGPTDTDANLLSSAPFTVYVTPEPSSFLLLGTGIAGMIAAFKRRRNNLLG